MRELYKMLKQPSLKKECQDYPTILRNAFSFALDPNKFLGPNPKPIAFTFRVGKVGLESYGYSGSSCMASIILQL